MDNWHLLDDDTQKAIISKWSLAKRAENGYLDEYLSLKEICDLLYPVPPWPRRPEYSTSKAYSADKDAYNDAKNRNSLFLDRLISDCKKGLLGYEGDINGWRYLNKNPYPLTKTGYKAGVKPSSIFIPGFDRDFNGSGQTNSFSGYTCKPSDCVIHKIEFKRYLQDLNQWSIISGLLANWWPDEQTLTDTSEDAINSLAADKLPTYLDPKHPMFSEELSIAIRAWDAVLECNPDKPKQGSRKKLIENWLENHHKTLTKEAKIRIATLLNPDKNGGAPSSD